MKMRKYYYLLLIVTFLSSCNDKKSAALPKTKIPADTIALKINNSKDEFEGFYETHAEDDSEECKISLEIRKGKDGYFYYLKTKARQQKGKAVFITEQSGEQFLMLEGIKWDEYEGDISNDEENDSISDSKELEIPIGISAAYVKDTLTIQNYGNAMNYYTILSECGRKYIRLIKK